MKIIIYISFALIFNFSLGYAQIICKSNTIIYRKNKFFLSIDTVNNTAIFEAYSWDGGRTNIVSLDSLTWDNVNQYFVGAKYKIMPKEIFINKQGKYPNYYNLKKLSVLGFVESRPIKYNLCKSKTKDILWYNRMKNYYLDRPGIHQKYKDFVHRYENWTGEKQNYLKFYESNKYLCPEEYIIKIEEFETEFFKRHKK